MVPAGLFHIPWTVKGCKTSSHILLCLILLDSSFCLNPCIWMGQQQQPIRVFVIITVVLTVETPWRHDRHLALISINNLDHLLSTSGSLRSWDNESGTNKWKVEYFILLLKLINRKTQKRFKANTCVYIVFLLFWDLILLLECLFLMIWYFSVIWIISPLNPSRIGTNCMEI